MTALSALWRLDGAPAINDLQQMQAAMSAYADGPLALWDGGAIALVRQLTLTLPEDIHDRGVIVGGDGHLALAADLRIDNRTDLVRALGLDVGAADAWADSQVLLAGWERWGPRVVERLTGVFAFCMWDARARALYLARDPGGQRPMFWSRGHGLIAVASMPSGLFPMLGGTPEPERKRVLEFLVLSGGRGPESWFRGISRVEKGSLVRVDASGRAQVDRFWRPEDIAPLRLADPREYADGLNEHLVRAVGAQLRSSARVATQLSSGLDSSAVTAVAARLLQQRGKVLDAFTHVPNTRYAVVAPVGRYGDEGPLAAETAARIPNLRHHLQTMPDMPLFSLHERLHAAFQAPTGNTVNGLWLDQMFRTARAAGVGVMLQGVAGNFTISYGGFEAPAEFLGRGHLVGGLKHLWALHRGEGLSLHRLAYLALAGRLPAPLVSTLHRLRGRSPAQWHDLSALRQACWGRAEVMETLAADRADLPGHPARDGTRLRIALLQRGDQGTYVKGFQALYGMDLRDPTRDLDLVRFCLSTPTEMFSQGGRARSLYRLAFKDLLPPAVLNNKMRGEQGANWRDLVSRDKALLSAELEAGGQPMSELIDYAALAQDVGDIDRIKHADFDGAGRIYHRLLRGLTLIRFLRQWAL